MDLAATDAIGVAALSRRAHRIAAAWMSPAEVDALAKSLARDRNAFAGPMEVWAFLVPALLIVSIARQVVAEGRVSEARARHLSAKLQRYCRRSAHAATETHGAHERLIRQGRPRASELRDLVLRGLVEVYPDRGRTKAKFITACELAFPIWSKHFDPGEVDQIRRDMRKRAQARTGLASFETSLFVRELHSRAAAILVAIDED